MSEAILRFNRRKAGILDFDIVFDAGVTSYGVAFASNFDQSYSTIFTVVRGRDHIGADFDRRLTVSASSARNQSDTYRVLVDPTSYFADTDPIWVRVTPNGGSAESMHMVLAVSDGSARPTVSISGTVPIGASISNSIVLVLPTLSNFDVLNAGTTGGNNLGVSLYQGSEMSLTPRESYSTTFGTVSRIKLRGIDGTAPTVIVGARPWY